MNTDRCAKEPAMIEVKRILCAVDFSTHSRRALDHATALARWYDATLTALYVYPPAPVPAVGPSLVAFDPPILTELDREQLARDLQAFVAAESGAPVAVDSVVREGYPATTIAECALDTNADLLVLGTHGRTGFERLLLGSVAERVLRHAPCPVLTVPTAHRVPTPAASPVFKDIVCAIDFSAASIAALDYALSLAREADARLTILHVASSTIEPSMFDLTADAGLTVAELRQRLERDLEAQLVATVPVGASEYCRVETLMTQGRPGPEIVRVAADLRADLIVMGVFGRGAVDLTVFGSTAQHVVRAASCPVLTIRRKSETVWKTAHARAGSTGRQS